MQEPLFQRCCMFVIRMRNTLVRVATVVFLGCWMLSSSALLSAEEISNTVGMKLRLLEAGRFEQGERDLAPGFYKDHPEFNTAGDEQPVHPVVLTKPFYLSTTEVTVAQFRQFVEATGHQTSAERNPRGAVGWDPMPPADNPRFLSTFRDDGGFNWKKPGFKQGDQHPVVGVSFLDAKAYCAWLSQKEGVTYRLPTEAEWEYAARAGTESYFSFGDVYRGKIQRFANIGNVELEKAFPDRVRRQWLVDITRDTGDRDVFTAPVGSYEANPWGLHDLHGNVWEWCEDIYLDTAYTPFSRPGYQQVRKRAIDPLNVEKGSDAGEWRVIRGGSWFNSPIQCRSAVRGYFEPSDAACYLGFRVVRNVPATVEAASLEEFSRSEAARKKVEQSVERGQFQERRDGRLTLILRLSQLSTEFLEALQQLDEPVDIHLNGEGKLTRELIAALAKTGHLSGFLLSNAGSELSDEDFSVLADHPELELLQLTGTSRLTNGVCEYLREHERLELLHLEGNAITDEGLRLLPPLTRLAALQLSGTSAEGLVLDHFQNSPLRTFTCSHLTDAAAAHLEHFPEMRELSLGKSAITGRGLAALSRLPLLSRLMLENCQGVQDEDFAVLRHLGELRSIFLQQTAAGDVAVSGLMPLNNLRELSLGSPQLTDEGVRRLCEIVSLNQFFVTSDATEVTDAGLTDLWRLTNLRSLSVAAPRVTGSGLATLGELPKLDWLQLSGPGISDLALKYAASSETLRQLSVGDGRTGGPAALTDAGLRFLSESNGLTRFELIRRETQITDAGVTLLRERRPQLSVNVR